MNKLKVDDEVYSAIASRTKRIGESGNTILRRVFGLEPLSRVQPSQPDVGTRPPQNRDEELVRLVRSAAYQAIRTPRKRYLRLLEAAHRQHPEAFAQTVLSLPQKRKRKFFAATREEIEQAGTSTSPRPVPHSSLWALTNSSTLLKREMLTTVLSELGYSPSVVAAAAESLPTRDDGEA